MVWWLTPRNLGSHSGQPASQPTAPHPEQLPGSTSLLCRMSGVCQQVNAVPHCCTPQRLRASFRVRCTQVVAILGNVMNRLFHIPWPVFCQETWAEVQGISLTLENVEQCQILWQIKPWMSQSGIHRQWKYLMLYSVPWFTLTQEMQECISLTRKYFPPNVSDPCKNKWNSNSHKLKQPLQK